MKEEFYIVSMSPEINKAWEDLILDLSDALMYWQEKVVECPGLHIYRVTASVDKRPVK